MKTTYRKTILIIALATALFSTSEQACTGIRLIAGDGTVVHARTMEFAIDIHSEIMMSPRGFARTGATPDGKEGLKWKSKYASVGANGLDLLFPGPGRWAQRKGSGGGHVLLFRRGRLHALHRGRGGQDSRLLPVAFLDTR